MPHALRRWTDHPATLFWGVTAVAFLLRLIHIVAMSDAAVNPAFHLPVTDAAVNRGWALGLLDGTWPGAEPYFRAPLYPHFLALLYGVFGRTDPLSVQLAHGFVSALGAGLAGTCARRLWDARAGWAAGLLLATSWSSIHFSAELLDVSLGVTLNLWLLHLLLCRQTGRRLVAAGLVLGLSAIARPTILAVLPVVLWWLARQADAVWPVRWRAWAWLLLGLVLVIGPVAGRNLMRGGEPVLIGASGGVNFWIGNNPWADGRVAFLPGAPPTWQGTLAEVKDLASEEAGRPLTARGADRHFWRQGLDFWRESPTAALRLTARKAWLVLAAGERSNNKNLAFWRARSPLLKWPVWPGWALLLGLGVLGLTRRDLAPDRRRFLVGLLVLSVLALLPFFVNARFRLPLLAWLAVPAGGGLVALWSAVRGRTAEAWPRLAPWAVAALVAVSVVPDALTYHQDPATDFESWRALGNTHLSNGAPDLAIAAWEEALRADRKAPRDAHRWTLPQLYRPLAQLMQQRGRRDLVLGVRRMWVERLPDDDDGRLGLANHLLEDGDAAGACVHLEVVLARTPDNTDAQLGHGWALHHTGEHERALARFEALERGTGNVSAMMGAATCLADLARWDQAEARLVSLLKARPSLWQARVQLAAVYRATGEIAREEAAWRAVLQARPDHAEARQRLGR